MSVDRTAIEIKQDKNPKEKEKKRKEKKKNYFLIYFQLKVGNGYGT